MLRRIGLLSLLCVLCAPVGGWAGARKAEPSPAMLHKVSPVLLEQWRTTRERRGEPVWVECFLRLTGAATPAMMEALHAVDVVERSVIPQHRGRQHPATLLTARVRLARLPAVAALHFVESIDGAARVGLKAEERIKVSK